MSGSPKTFDASNTFDTNFTDVNGNTKALSGTITKVWSGFTDRTSIMPLVIYNKFLQIRDTVYFLGKHNKSYGTVTRFSIKYVGNVEHYMIQCQLRVQKGDSGGLLFKHNKASSTNAEEFIADGICSTFIRTDNQIYGDISYFVPLIDLDQSIYEWPTPTHPIPPIP